VSMSREFKQMRNIFTDEVIRNLKDDKSQITEDLLAVLRSRGNEGKKIALEILDLNVDDEQYYLDAYNNRISFNGNRMLKKPFTKLALSDIHEIELRKCNEDVHYFKDNYVQITTQKGLNFPDLREYQNDFIDVLLPDEHETVVGLLPRQCCSENTTVKIKNGANIETMTFKELFNECKQE